MLGSIAIISYALAALAFALFAILLATRWRSRFAGQTLIIACAVSSAWAAFVVVKIFSPYPFSLIVDVLEVARGASWSFFLLTLVSPTANNEGGTRSAMSPMRIAFVAVYSILFLTTLYGHLQPVVSQSELGALIILGGRTVAAVMGMLFVEQLFRNSAEEDRWGIKFACIGIGGLFAYDFYLYSDALLFRRLNLEIWASRGIVNALIVPLIALSVVRNPHWTSRLSVSRRVLFHSATVTGSALYLLMMAGTGYYLRYFGGSWGPVMQVGFLFAAVVLLIVILFSGTFRAWLKVFLSKHFYHYNYDYREEWLRFTRTLSEPGPGIEQRAIRAIAQLVESPSGVLFAKNESGGFIPTTDWNNPQTHGTEPVDSVLCQFLHEKNWVVDLHEVKEHPDRYPSLVLPGWLARIDNAWLIVPLISQADLIGFVVLAQSRSKIKMNWEVLDLLKIAGSQAAGSLAQKQASDALMLARQFESFNRMSTFVVHDLKNLVSQLSLLVANAERHRDSPEFQRDMLDTVSHSVDRMKVLLQKFSRGSQLERPAPISVQKSVCNAIASKSAGVPKPVFDIADDGLMVYANQARFERVIGHLIQNAMEATPRDGKINIRLFRDHGNAVFELTDNGSGMSEEFIRDRLFKPFESTKVAGMGIGVFESREYINELGGKLDVTSKPGSGTRFTIALPLHEHNDYSVLNAALEER